MLTALEAAPRAPRPQPAQPDAGDPISSLRDSLHFKHIPESGLDLGYPLAILAMMLSATVPIDRFRRKGWL